MVNLLYGLDADIRPKIISRKYLGYTSDTNVLIYFKESGIPDNEIWYTSEDGNIITGMYVDSFDATIVSNTYDSGKGIIKFDKKIQQIGDSAFDSCEYLTSIILPKTVTYIGESAFAFQHIKTFTIPESVSSLGLIIFQNSTLESINVDSNNITYNDGNNSNCVIETTTNDLIIGCTNTIIPSTVTSIHEWAFVTAGFSSITLPDALTSIKAAAFMSCSNLTSVIYKGTTYTSKSALTTALTNGGVTVATSAFQNTGLAD